MSSTGSGWELDVMPLSDIETGTPACAPPASPLPFEELNLPLTGAVATLLVRCDILGFLLARGSMKSAAGRFWEKNSSFSVAEPKIGFNRNSIHLRLNERKTAVQVRANKNGRSCGGQGSEQYKHRDGESNTKKGRSTKKDH